MRIDDNKIARVGAVLEDSVLLTLLDSADGLGVGSRVFSDNSAPNFLWSDQLFGSCVDTFGKPLDRAPLETGTKISLNLRHRSLTERKPLTGRILTGVSALDRFTPLMYGQRILVIAEPGVGKTTLLWDVAERGEADVVVLALVGERSREAAEILRMRLGDKARRRTVIVVSTADESPARRSQSAITAFQIAGYHADRGRHVLLLFDSLTRYARSLRDEALSTGELPIRRGYPASVFSGMARILEQAGYFNSEGSITGIFTMLTENEEDPMVEEVKGVVDGHITLRREIAEQGTFPALSPAESLSRLEREALSQLEHQQLLKVRRLFSRLLRDKKLALFADNLDDELKSALEKEPSLWRLVTDKNYTFDAFLGQDSSTFT